MRLHFCALPYKFTGKERDAESGLDFFGARYYASSMGRWMSPDWSAKEEAIPYAKLGDPQTLNLYGYVGNNPLRKVDVDGHCSLDGSSNRASCAADAMQRGLDPFQAMNDFSAASAYVSSFAAGSPQLAQQQPSVTDQAKNAGGIVGTVKKWFGRGQSAQKIVQNGAEYRMWQKTQTLADQAYQRDPTSSYGYMQLMVSQLAQANESYLVIEAGVKTNSLLNGVPILGDVQSAMLPAVRQAVIFPAEQNYRDALHAWQTDTASQH